MTLSLLALTALLLSGGGAYKGHHMRQTFLGQDRMFFSTAGTWQENAVSSVET